MRRTKTGGFKSFDSTTYGCTWPSTVGCNDDDVADAGCFQPNAATGFLLQSILRGHVDAQCILEDEVSFWSRHSDHVDKVLISTRLESYSPLMSDSFFALPLTPKYTNGLSMDQRSIAYLLQVEAFHRIRSTIEIDINNYTSLIYTFCNSFNLPTNIISAKSFRCEFCFGQSYGLMVAINDEIVC